MSQRQTPLHPRQVTLTRSSSLSSQSKSLLNRSPVPLTYSSTLSTKDTPIIRSSSLLTTKPSSTALPSYRQRSNSLPQKPQVIPPVPILIPPKRSSSLKRAHKVDEDIRKSLIDWKDKSIIHKLDWSNLFASHHHLWTTNDNIFGSIENLLLPPRQPVVMDNDYKEIQIIVDSLWLENEQYATKKNIASYLGKLDPFHHKILSHYLDRFDFQSLTIEEAFRKLCSKLYFKAEAQEIDRILEAFSYKYWNLNKNFQPLYRSPDIVYTITYSIMLLNTDLYFINSNHTRMTCQLFCDNTMGTIIEHTQGEDEEWKQSMHQYLKSIYMSVKSHGILQPINTLERKTSLLKRMGSLTRKKGAQK